MSRLIVLFFTCFALDNILVNSFSIQPIFHRFSAIPNVFLMCLIMFIFFDRSQKIYIFAFVFGLLYDICYADLFGLYVLLFPCITFIVQKTLAQIMPVNILSILALLSICIAFEETCVYFLVQTMYTTNMSLIQFITYLLTPTILFNGVILLFMYPILKSQFKIYQWHLDRS
ncbi:MAG TPA: rod shape-determining protein MreD [Firmicutes bacterium]|nr:rod shape-determining protein MreD [Bacillota bacterium]